jgi:hypothetical protein
LYKGKYKALIQTGNVKVYRYANRDDKYDYDESSGKWGMFGINIHRVSMRGIVNYINRFSAGCRAVKDPSDFDEMILLCEKSLKYSGNGFRSITRIHFKPLCKKSIYCLQNPQLFYVHFDNKAEQADISSACPYKSDYFSSIILFT